MKAQSRNPFLRACALVALSLPAALGCGEDARVETAPSALRSEGDDALRPADCEERFRFVAGDGALAHQVMPGHEGYQSFAFDVPWGDRVQAVAMHPLVDNRKVVHHFTLYDGKGAHLAHWAPGGTSEPLPDDVGRFVPAGGTLRLEVHYYNKNPGAVPEPDRSGFEVCITRTPRAHTAGMYPFAALPLAPAGRVTPSTATCTVTSSAPVRVFSSAPHMHKLGVHAKLELLRASGATEVLHDQPFRFEEQQAYPLDVTLQPGDRVRTTCVYENPGLRTVSLGLGSDDEMCFNFVLYYPLCGLTCSTGLPAIDQLVDGQNGECAAGGGGVHAHPDAGVR